MQSQKILHGLLAGFLSAVVVDIHAWQNDGFAVTFAKTFDWRLALTRWIQGALSGALVGFGVGGAA